MTVEPRLTVILAVLVLLAWPTAASAGDEKEAVGALLGAAPGGKSAQPDDDALAGLLAGPGRDPWLLVEHLLARNRQDIAIRLAKRTSEEAIGPLRLYAQAPDAAEGGAERQSTLHAALEAKEAGEIEAVQRHTGRVRAGTRKPTVFGVRAADVLGDALASAERSADAVSAWIAGGEEAVRIGWWAAGERLLSHALETAYLAGNFELAARACEGQRAVFEIRGDGNRLAGAEHDLGAIAQARGNLPAALRHFNESLSMYEALDRTADVVSVRSIRSFVLAELGEFAAAMEEQSALTRYYADRPRDTPWAENQLQLGLVRYRLGDEQGALDALSRALAAFEESGDKWGEVQAHGNLGLAYAQAGRWPEAVEANRAAMSIAKSLGDAYFLAVARLNLADVLLKEAWSNLRAPAGAADAPEGQAGRTSALTPLAQAHALIEEVLPVAHKAGALGLSCSASLTLGEILLAEGKLDQARTLLEQARDDAGQLGAWRSHLVGTVLLARVHLGREDWRSTLREARAAAEELGRSLAGLADADLARARARAPDVFDIGVTAAVRMNSLRDLAYFLEAGRASALLSGLGGRAAALRATIPNALAERLTSSTRAKLEAFTAWRESRSTKHSEARRLWMRYDELRKEEQSALEDTQRAQAAAAKRLAPARLASIREIRARLRATARPGLNQVFVVFNFQSAEAVALVVEQSGARVVTYAADDVAALRGAFAKLLATAEDALDETALASVKERLIDPLKIPAGDTRLFVCPDRDLAYAPLSAVLPDNWEIVWEPSATTYDLLSARGLRRGQRVLGLGDPDYSAAASSGTFGLRGGPRLIPLPGTRLEIESITGGADDRRLLSDKATERGFIKALEDGKALAWKSVHLACHGLVDVERPALSYLALTPGNGEDGFLTSSEILRLALRTDLAVLSACRTGRGKFVRGEGVMSLARAFMFAGASRVIVSLWNVDDKATAHLMQTFYREWNAGKGTAHALRLAQLAVRDHKVEETVREPGKPPRQVVRRPWAEPRYWAAWTLWGLPD